MAVTRKYQFRCHVCQFVKNYPDAAESLEAWLVLGNKSLQEIANYYNDHDYWREKHVPFTKKKLFTHRKEHLTNIQDIVKDAQQKALGGNITIEESVLESMTALNALKQIGINRIANGDITVNDVNDLTKIIATEQKLIGENTLDIHVTQMPTSTVLPMEILQQIISVVNTFVPAKDKIAFRKMLDEQVLPQFIEYSMNNHILEQSDIVEAEIVDD